MIDDVFTAVVEEQIFQMLITLCKWRLLGIIRAADIVCHVAEDLVLV